MEGLVMVLLCRVHWHFCYTLSWTSVDERYKNFFWGGPSLCVTGFSAGKTGFAAETGRASKNELS